MGADKFEFRAVLIILWIHSVVNDPISAQYPCPEQSEPYAVCDTTVLYIIDTSLNLRASEITAEFEWIRNNIVPGTAWNTSQKLVLYSYGIGHIANFFPTWDRTNFCAQLNSIQMYLEILKIDRNNSSLLSTMKIVDHYHDKDDTINNIVLFSGSKNREDIKEAGDFIKTNMAKHFTVIAMDGADFSGFPATVIYNVESLTHPPSNLASCIIKSACSQSCTIQPLQAAEL